jgi:choline transporter-like protein 2/4/5
MAMKWGMFYHLGSLAWGSFLIAVTTMIKVIFEYFAKKAEMSGAANNPVAKAFLCCARCAIWCLDSCVKFISKNAYIQVALHSKAFCTSAWESFYLTIRHAGRFSAASISSMILSFLGKGVIVGLSVWLTILAVAEWSPQTKSPVLPAVVVGIFAFMVSSLFLSLFTFSALTIMHCFIVDEDFGGSDRTPDSLKEFLEKADTH